MKLEITGPLTFESGSLSMLSFWMSLSNVEIAFLHVKQQNAGIVFDKINKKNFDTDPQK